MRVVAFLIGLILLLPGVCALGFFVIGLSTLPPPGSNQWADSSLWGIIGVALLGWGFCFLISFAGILMMRAALRSPTDPKGAFWKGDPPSGDGSGSAL